MQNPFLTLGIPVTSDTDAVRIAYRRLVKKCHPDAVLDEGQKLYAQEKMIALNLAYEQALKMACHPTLRVAPAPLDDTLRLAQKLLERKMPSSALRTLERHGERSAVWYFLHGRVLHELGQYALAHQSLRRAVRLEPGNNEFRMAALRAFTAERDSHKITQRVSGWAKDILHTRKG